jgi:hypothetical protein
MWLYVVAVIEVCSNTNKQQREQEINAEYAMVQVGPELGIACTHVSAWSLARFSRWNIPTSVPSSHIRTSACALKQGRFLMQAAVLVTLLENLGRGVAAPCLLCLCWFSDGSTVLWFSNEKNDIILFAIRWISWLAWCFCRFL